MIRDSAAGIAPRKGDLKRIRALRFTEPGFDRAAWRKMCDMGWLGLRVAEDNGGSGLGVRELCGLAEELGAGLVPEPLIPAAMAAALLPPDHLAEVLSGDRIVLPAWQEQPNSLALSRRYGTARWQAERAQGVRSNGSRRGCVPGHCAARPGAGGARCTRRARGI